MMCAGSGEWLLLVMFCLCFGWSLVSCLNLALTSFLERFLLALYANLGVVLVNLFRIGISVLMAVQCLWTILNALCALGQYLVTNVGLEAASDIWLSRFLFLVMLYFDLSVNLMLDRMLSILFLLSSFG